jgi:hypothetical protein
LEEGTENLVVLAMLIECCKLHGANPHTYLPDIFTKLVNLWPNSHIEALTPWASKAANPTP